LTYSHQTRSLHDRVQHEIRDDATGEVVETYPPSWGGYSGQRLRLYVLERVAELNKQPLPPIDPDYIPSREHYPRFIREFSPAERTRVFVTLKCLKCHKGPLYRYPHKRFVYCPQCDIHYYVKADG